jgi:hypothetical protein
MGLAVEYPKKTCIQHMLEHPSANHLYLDYYPGDRESTVREIIAEVYPDLESFLPAPLKERLDSDGNKKLLAALQHDKYDVFIENVDSKNPNPWYDEPYHSTLLEIACQMKNRKQFVKILLDNGADPNTMNRVTGMPLLHATVRSRNFEVLQVLLENERVDTSLKDYKDRTILHWLAQVRERKPSDKYILENCFKFLLDRHHVTKIGIDDRDFSENTALYIALEKGFRDRAKLLMCEGADVGMLGNACTVLLPTTLPILEEILEDCLESNDELIASKDIEVRLNSQLLMNIVPPIAESRQLRVLLKHPVISTFLSLKWQKFKYFVFLNMVFYVLFVVALTAYVLNDGMYTLWYFLLIFLFILTGREVIQLNADLRTYVRSPENWLEISLIVFSFILVSRSVDNMEIKLHFSAIVLFLGWFELMLMSGRLPQLSLKLEMFKTVSLTFFSFMAGYVLLLIAFALSFYILFRRSTEPESIESFSSPLFSSLKTIIMFTGEFEASSLSFDTLPYTSHAIFILFVLLVPIILLNLLNGLAVSDTDGIRKTAETLTLLARARLILKFDTGKLVFLKWLRYDATGGEEMPPLYPNRPNSIGSTQSRSVLEIISKKRQANKKCEDKWSALELRQEKLERKLDEALQILTRLNTAECEATHL